MHAAPGLDARTIAVACALVAIGCGARSDLDASGPASGAGGTASRASSSSIGGSGGAPATSSNVSSSVTVSSSDVVTSVSSSTASSSSASSSTASSSSSSSSSSSASSSSGTGGAPPATGCSDGTREGFVDEATYPGIAACSGGWDVPGVLQATSTHCGRAAGNSSANPSGVGCGALDLCAQGFHVCRDADDVAQHSPTGCQGAAPGPNLFFATRQGSTGCAICTLGNNTDPTVCNGCSCAMNCASNATTANDVFGCGSIGDPVTTNCGPIDRFSNNLCVALGGPWQCGSDGCNESNDVTKTGPSRGGVLCCAN